MGVSTAAGATLSIGTTAAVGSTDTYTAVGEVVGLPEFGRVYNVVKYTPLATRNVQKFKGSYDDGDIAIPLGKNLGDAGQAAMLVARDVDLDYNFQIVANDAVAVGITTGIAISVATPGIVTAAAHGLPAGTAVKFSVGTVPTGLTLGVTYYVTSGATLLAGSFAVSTTLALALAGTGITTTGSPGSGLTMTTVPSNTVMLLKAKVTSFTTKMDNVDSVIMSTASLSIKSGSIVETVHLP